MNNLWYGIQYTLLCLSTIVKPNSCPFLTKNYYYTKPDFDGSCNLSIQNIRPTLLVIITNVLWIYQLLISCNSCYLESLLAIMHQCLSYMVYHIIFFGIFFIHKNLHIGPFNCSIKSVCFDFCSTNVGSSVSEPVEVRALF